MPIDYNALMQRLNGLPTMNPNFGVDAFNAFPQNVVPQPQAINFGTPAMSPEMADSVFGGKSPKPPKQPKTKDGGMWDAMLAALASSVGGMGAARFPGYPGLHPVNVGSSGRGIPPVGLYGPVNYQSILAQLLKRR